MGAEGHCGRQFLPAEFFAAVVLANSRRTGVRIEAHPGLGSHARPEATGLKDVSIFTAVQIQAVREAFFELHTHEGTIPKSPLTDGDRRSADVGPDLIHRRGSIRRTGPTMV
jgi:hypothetical protein